MICRLQQKPKKCGFALLLRRCRRLLMDRSARGAIEHGATAGVFADQDKEGDGGHHKEDGSPGGKAGEHVGGAARTEGGLRSLATEGASEIGALALLQQDNRDEKERDDDVNDGQEDDHATAF